MAKKLHLDLKYVPEFEVIGIFTSLVDYRLCWLINKNLSKKFQKINDIRLTPYKSKNKEYFSLFEYKNQDLEIKYYLLKNYSGRQLLLPDNKSLDYLMLLKSNEIRIDINELISKLRNIPQIAAAIWFNDLDKIKNLNDVLYEFETAMVNRP